MTSIIWQKKTTRDSRAAFSSHHDTILVYAPSGPRRWKTSRNLLVKDEANLRNRDNDPRGPWTDAPFTAPGYRKAQQYDIATPTGKVLRPPRGRSWYATEPTFRDLLAADRIWFRRCWTSSCPALSGSSPAPMRTGSPRPWPGRAAALTRDGARLTAVWHPDGAARRSDCEGEAGSPHGSVAVTDRGLNALLGRRSALRPAVPSRTRPIRAPRPLSLNAVRTLVRDVGGPSEEFQQAQRADNPRRRLGSAARS